MIRATCRWTNPETGIENVAIFGGADETDIDFLADIHERQLGIEPGDNRWVRRVEFDK